MSAPVELLTFSELDLTTRIELGSFVVPRAGLYGVAVEFEGLAASAASLTVDLVLQRGGNNFAGPRLTHSKMSSTSTREATRLLLINARSGDTISVSAVSTNGSDTDIDGSVYFHAASEAVPAYPEIVVDDDAFSVPEADTMFIVAEGDHVKVGDVLSLYGELMLVTGISNDTLTVTRGYRGTTPESLYDGAVLRIVDRAINADGLIRADARQWVGNAINGAYYDSGMIQTMAMDNNKVSINLDTIADKVWDELTSGHLSGGTFGHYLQQSIGTPLANGVTLADDAITAAKFDESTAFPLAAASSTLATAANQTTILNRIGAFTGTGVNTILGFFKALLSKSASTPSDVGGTFDPSTDSVEAVAENGAAVKAKTDLITTDGVTARVVSPVAPDGLTLDLVRSDDYTDGDVDRPVVIDVLASDVEWAASDVASVSLIVRDKQSGSTLFTASGTATATTNDDDEAVIRATINVDADDTALLTHGKNTALFDLLFTMNDGTRHKVVVDGEVNVAGA